MHQRPQESHKFKNYIFSLLFLMIPSVASADDRVFLFELPGEIISVSPFTVVLQDMNAGILVAPGEVRYRKESPIFVRADSAQIQVVCNTSQYTISITLPSTPVFDFSDMPTLDDLSEFESFDDFLEARADFLVKLEIDLGDNQQTLSTSFIPELDQISESGRLTAPIFLAMNKDHLYSFKSFNSFLIKIEPSVGDSVVLIDFDFQRFGEALEILIKHCGDLSNL